MSDIWLHSSVFG